MEKRRVAPLLALLLLLASTGTARGLPVFPEARGHGADTIAGRGGTIYVVDSLLDVVDPNDGVTTLREAVEACGARTVLFEVSGYIDLSCPLSIRNPNITISGQTAPAPGVTLRYDRLNVMTHDVLIQHLRFRIGDQPFDSPAATYEFHGAKFVSSGAPHNCPAPTCDPQDGPVQNVVIDHCSFSWAIGIGLCFWHSSIDGVTVSNTILSESLNRSTHWKGAHSKGILLGVAGIDNVTFYRNLIAHTVDRNPLLAANTSAIFVNNLVYNTGYTAVVSGGGAIELTLEGNYFRSRATTDPFFLDLPLGSRFRDNALNVHPGVSLDTEIYLADNLCPNNDGTGGPVCPGCDPWLTTVNHYDGAPEPPALVAPGRVLWPDPPLAPEVIPSGQVLASVTATAGAFPNSRDATDTRIVDEAIQRTGQMIDCVESMPLDHHGGVLDASTSLQGPNGILVPSVILRDAPGLSNSSNVLRGYRIRVEGDSGSEHDRRIETWDAVQNAVGFDTPIEEAVSEGNDYQIYTPCAANVNGWPPLLEQVRPLVLPDQPNEVEESGYTRLEEWIHGFDRSPTVEYSIGRGKRSLDVEFSTDLWVGSRVEYRPADSAASWSSAVASVFPARSHGVRIDDLEPATRYELRAVSNVIDVEHLAPVVEAATRAGTSAAPGGCGAIIESRETESGAYEIEVCVPEYDLARLEIRDGSGRVVHTLQEGRLERGRHVFFWDETIDGAASSPRRLIVYFESSAGSFHTRLDRPD